MITDIVEQDTLYERDYIIINGNLIYINAKIYDDCYNNGNFIGSFIIKRIEFEYEEDFDFKEKEFQFVKEFKKANGNWESVNYGTFIVQSVEPSDTKETVKVTAYDFGIKFANPYTTSLDYSSGSITLKNVFDEILTNVGVLSDVTTFTNDDFIVDSNQFKNNETYGTVIAQIAGISGNFAHIYNDKLQLIFKNETNLVIEKSMYSNFEDKRDTHPITIVMIEDGQIEGENVSLRWEEGIEEYGENYFIISGNYFAFNQEKRTQLITALFNKIKGFSYSSVVLKDCLYPHLKCGDLIQIRAKDNTLVDSLVLRWNISDYSQTIEAPSIIKATVNYENPVDALTLAQNTQVIVNKQEQRIDLLATQADENTEEISKLEISTKEIKQEVGKIEVLTSEVTGIQNITLENCIPGKLMELHIVGNNNVFKPLYLGNSTILGDNTILNGNSTIIVNSTEYELGIEEELRSNSDVSDEFILKDGKSYIVRRVDAQGQTLENEIIEQLDDFTISLLEGSNTISIKSYSANIRAVYIPHNDYNDTFATQIEMNAAIIVSADQILSTVNQAFSNYSTTTQMNSAITQKADEITSEVSQSYSTKEETATAKTEAISSADANTDNKLVEYSTTIEMNSAISQSAEQIELQVEEISTIDNSVGVVGSEVLHLTNTVESESGIKSLEITGFELMTPFVFDLEIRLTNEPPTSSSSDLFVIIPITQTQDNISKLTIENNEAIVEYIDDTKETFENIVVPTFDNDTYISIYRESNLTYTCSYYIKNFITSNFANKSSIRQTANEINLVVSKKVGENEIISKINQTAEQTTIESSKININGVISANGNFEVDLNGNMTANNGTFSGTITSSDGTIGGWTVNSSGLTNGAVKVNSDGASTIYTVADLIVIRGYLMGYTGFDLPPAMISHYDFNGDGAVTASDYVTLQNLIGISMN